MITDAGGDALKQTRYMPFGGKRGEAAGITVSNYMFTDQELDKESGLYNYDARLYDPIVGKFASADSVVPDFYNSQQLNRYLYCFNNPLSYIDPSGHHNQEYGDDMGGFEGLGIGNPGSYGGSNDPTNSGSNNNDGSNNSSSKIGYGWGYWGAGVISEQQYGSIVTQVEVSVWGVVTFRAIDISKNAPPERSRMEQIFSPKTPNPIDWDKLPPELREKAKKDTLRALGVAAGVPAVAVAAAVVGPEVLGLALANPVTANEVAVGLMELFDFTGPPGTPMGQAMNFGAKMGKVAGEGINGLRR